MAVVFSLAVASVIAIIVLAGTHADRWALGRNAALGAAALLVVALFVRTRPLRVTRAGRELRIRAGRRRESVLISEVHEVEIDTRADRAHAVVLVLEGNRRLDVGDPFERMSDAVAERRTLRNALTRP